MALPTGSLEWVHSGPWAGAADALTSHGPRTFMA